MAAMLVIFRTLLAVVFAVLVFFSTASTAKAQATTTTCNEWSEPQIYQDAIMAQAAPHNYQPAVIFGKPYDAPAMRMRFVDSTTGLPLKNLYRGRITVSYSWRWLQYPYPEHAWGA
jgi:hypothetical protein